MFPEVKAKLIDTGKMRYIYRDFPLDQVALTAAMVARALPASRYEAFVTNLLATQDRWAFARDVNTNEELFKRAALAGMPRATFDATHRRPGLEKRHPGRAAERRGQIQGRQHPPPSS